MPTAARTVTVEPGLRLGGAGGLFLIAGPCVIESRARVVTLAKRLAAIAGRAGVPFVFKASFDKANRSSLGSYRGPGLAKGLEVLRAVKEETGVPVLSDVHETWQAEKAAEVLDILQVPAFLCRQTDLVLAAARTMKPINIKKGQFMAPGDMRLVVEKALSVGNACLLLTERGTTFGYGDLVVDMRSIPVLKALGFPVVIDASHAVQKPGGAGAASGGERGFIPTVARAAVAAGADGLFVEVHDDPARALSDKDNALPLGELEELLDSLLRLRRAL
jgi:2-dehydro-3-deoxyphosphooctonate aldolase (KDO 8-P synthase)